MDQAFLHQLLSRYVAGKCTEEECRLVEHWYELVGEPLDINLTDEQWRELEARIWQRLQPTPAPVTRAGIARPLWRRLAAAGAAVAAMAVLILGVNRYRHSQHVLPGDIPLVAENEQAEWIQHVNHDAEVKIIYLPDSSQVILEPRSTLAVSRSFNLSNREVRLVGEAVFDVERDPALPFIVYSGNMAAKVLGTRFRVKAVQPGQPVEVDVQSGKVTVYNSAPKSKAGNPAGNGLILTQNQKATYFPDTDQFVAGLTDLPEPIEVPAEEKTREAIFIFEETPVNEVARLLKEVYGTEIELEQETLGSCPFTGNLSQQSLFDKLDLLCGAINGTYEVRGTKILITGKGCN